MATATEGLLIESVFIDRLMKSDLYADPVEGLVRALKEQSPNGLTIEVLQRAADSIIRNHSSGAFPKTPACLRAIQEALYAAPAPSAVAGTIDPTTRHNYADRAIAHCRKHGGKPIVISRLDDPDAWKEWELYFERAGMPASASMMREAQASSWTVPAKHPWEFDITAEAFGPQFKEAAE
jgi:hypothetical protein